MLLFSLTFCKASHEVWGVLLFDFVVFNLNCSRYMITWRVTNTNRWSYLRVAQSTQIWKCLISTQTVYIIKKISMKLPFPRSHVNQSSLRCAGSLFSHGVLCVHWHRTWKLAWNLFASSWGVWPHCHADVLIISSLEAPFINQRSGKGKWYE